MTIAKNPAPNLPVVHVFVSYSRRNSSMLTQVVADGLAQRRIAHVFVDVRMTDGAGPFPDRLERALEVCRVFVCLLGETTLDSAWVLREIEIAHQLGKPMIPVFQESYDPAKGAAIAQNSPSVAALLQSDGVHILDVKNLHIPASLDDLARMIRRTRTASAPTPRRWLWGGLLVLGVAALSALGLALVNSQGNGTPPPTIPPTSVALQPMLTSAPLSVTYTPSLTHTPPTLTPATELGVDEIIGTNLAGTQTRLAESWTPTPSLSPTITRTPTITLTPTLNNAQKAATSLPLTLTATVWTPTPLPAGFKRSDRFGVNQVYVPAGCFPMGSDPNIDKDDQKNEQPQHRVCLTQGYWLDENEVTNEAFDAFVKAGGYTTPQLWSKDGWQWLQQQTSKGPASCISYSSAPKQPRICVNYYEAEAYANWRGGRLPTEAEWEYAARGPSGLIYPWGNTWDKAKANTYESGIDKSTAVCSYPAGNSWVGACDMAGNAWELVRDWDTSDYYTNRPNPDNDPTGPGSGLGRALRGGSWREAASVARTAFRSSYVFLEVRYGYISFRVVMSAPVP